MIVEQDKQMSKYWTKEILSRCTPRELVVITAAYGVQAVAERMDIDIQKFIEDNNNVSRPS